MGLGIMNESKITPDLDSRTIKLQKQSENHPIKEYYIEQLNLPQNITPYSIREVLAFVDDMLNGKKVSRVLPSSEANYKLAQHIISEIKDHRE